MSDGLGALRELVLARWRSFYREPGVLFWSFGFPILLSLALGIAFRNRPAALILAAVENAEGGETLRRELADGGDILVEMLSPEAARAALRTGKVEIVVVPGTPRTYRFDPSRSESRLARALVDARLQRAEGRKDAFEPAEVRITEPGSRYIDFLIPGLIGSGLMQGGLWGVAYVIVEMRTKKLMKRLVATPMKKRDFLLAFVLVRALFLLVELPALVGFGTLVFDVPMRGSLWLFAAVATFGSLSFAGLGLLLASRAENTQTVGGLINLASLPMFIASGTFFPSSRFPAVIQPFVRALPLTALNDALRAVMLEGVGIRAITMELLIIGVWGAASFGLALKFFRWR